MKLLTVMSNDVQNNNISQCTEHFSNISLTDKDKTANTFLMVLLVIIATVFNWLKMTYSYQKCKKLSL